MLSYYLYAILISGHFKLSGKAKTSRAPTDLAEDPKKLLLDSEFLAGEAGIVIYSQSLKAWQPPFEAEVLTEADKDNIKTRVLQSLAKHKIPVE